MWLCAFIRCSVRNLFSLLIYTIIYCNPVCDGGMLFMCLHVDMNECVFADKKAVACAIIGYSIVSTDCRSSIFSTDCRPSSICNEGECHCRD